MADDSSSSKKEPGPIQFSPIQHRLVTTALAGLSVFTIGALLFGLFLLLNMLVQNFSGVLWPLAVAGILSMLLRPLVEFLEENTRLGRLGGVLVIYSIVLLLVGVFLWFLVPILIEQTIYFIRNLPTIIDGIKDFFQSRFPQIEEFLTTNLGEERLAEFYQELENQIAKLPEQALPVATKLGSYLTWIAATGAGLAIIPVYLFFFLSSKKDSFGDIEKQLSWVRKDFREDIIFLAKHFAHSMESFFQGQILIGLIMGLLMAIGFSIAGVDFGFPLGIGIGLLNIIPYFGTVIGLATVLPIAWFQPDGGLLLAGIALGIFVAVQLFESYFLTPRIMGNRTGLHPLTIIISIFFWGTALGGILGMILAIPLTAFFVVAWRLLREKYLKIWLSEN